MSKLAVAIIFPEEGVIFILVLIFLVNGVLKPVVVLYRQNVVPVNTMKWPNSRISQPA